VINDQEDQALPRGDFDENRPRRRHRRNAEKGEGESFPGVVIHDSFRYHDDPLALRAASWLRGIFSSHVALQYCNLGWTAPLVSQSALPIESPFACGE
jgi:hypothetical protein